MGCIVTKNSNKRPQYKNATALASETSFTVNEVEALFELYKKLSSSMTDDGLIHKEEFLLALMKNNRKQNIFADRIFDLFDSKQHGVIDFEEFVRSLNIFHPRTPESEKIGFAFKLYDLRHTGYIEREDLKEMVLALLVELDLSISSDVIDTMVDKTFVEADLNGDGKIDQEEWKEYVRQNPSLLKNMTLPYLTFQIGQDEIPCPKGSLQADFDPRLGQINYWDEKSRTACSPDNSWFCVAE